MTIQQGPAGLACCGICSAVGEGSTADRLQGRTLPAAARQLTGMPDEQICDEARIVLCPSCLTPYRCTCSAGFGEHTVGLARTTLPEARGLIGEPAYRALVDQLAGALAPPDRAVQTFAARALADHHLREGHVELVLALLHLARTGRIGAKTLRSRVADALGWDAQLLRLELDRTARSR